MKKLLFLTVVVGGMFGLLGGDLLEGGQTDKSIAVTDASGPSAVPALLAHIIGPGPTSAPSGMQLAGQTPAIIIGPGPDAAPAVTTMNS